MTRKYDNIDHDIYHMMEKDTESTTIDEFIEMIRPLSSEERMTIFYDYFARDEKINRIAFIKNDGSVTVNTYGKPVRVKQNNIELILGE